MGIMILHKLQERKVRKPGFRTMALAASLVLAFTWSYGSGEKPLLLHKENIKSRLSDRDIVILDVRASKDWNVSDKKIKGAVRRDPDEVTIWADKLPDNKQILLY